MIDKIKAEIEKMKTDENFIYSKYADGAIDRLEMCLAWAEELEKELKEIFCLKGYHSEMGFCDNCKEIEKAFHGEEK